MFEFKIIDGGTLMVDIFHYTSPLGFLERLADNIFLEQYMREFLLTKNQNLKRVAESQRK